MGRGKSLPPAWAKGLLLLTLRVSAASVMQTVSLVDSCGKTLHGDGMALTSHSESRRYYFVAAGTDCQLTLQAASPQDKVRFQFRFFLVYNMLRSPSATPPGTTVDLHAPASAQETAGPCATGSYLQFHDGRDHTARPLRGPLCGKTIPRPLLSSGRFLTLRLVTRGHHPRVDFVGDFTSLRTGLNASACRAESYFPCRNGHCIPRSLVCDGRMVDNCGDGTDQAVQPSAWCEGPPTPVSVLPSEAVGVRPKPATCEERQETPRQPPGVIPGTRQTSAGCSWPPWPPSPGLSCSSVAAGTQAGSSGASGPAGTCRGAIPSAPPATSAHAAAPTGRLR
ncbi:hypothetical protein JRQ81_009930 [Phrynocephalus forsythii]|uniref:CUB domain-containing protein n=1 Tax=Phrynocephalus forsythii TaxID=171643 RepID=A0A9Q0X925_9SAUR|nr:hypothetical protein JRQ81_009930 [Phrynocephalus forsythii]